MKNLVGLVCVSSCYYLNQLYSGSNRNRNRNGSDYFTQIAFPKRATAENHPNDGQEKLYYKRIED